jgi:GcrA cell cycle regulator
MTSPWGEVGTWTDDRIGQLKQLWEAGHSANQIAAELGGVSRNAVIGKIHRLGLSGRAKSPLPTAHTHHAAKHIKETRPKGNDGSEAFRIVHAIKKARATAPAIPAAIAPEPLEIIASRVSLLAAASNQCRWPAADDGSATMVCGARVRGGSFCAGHARIAFQPAGDRRRQQLRPVGGLSL